MGQIPASTGGSQFEPCPEGQYQAVVIDVVDVGWLVKNYDNKNLGYFPHVQVVYQVAEANMDGDSVTRDDGKRYLVFSRRMTLSADSRAAFYREVSGIIGEKNFKASQEAGEFDTEDLVGKNVLLTVEHNEGRDGRIYANVSGLAIWPKRAGEPIEVEDYTRRHARADYTPPPVSCFDGMEAARAWCEEQNVEFRPPREEKEGEGKNNKRPPSSPPVTEGPRADVKAKAARAAKVKELAQDDEPEVSDDEDPFADD